MLPELVARGVTPDLVTDQTSAHDPLHGYTLREGVSVGEATHLLTVVTSFPAFDELFHAVGLPVDVVADRLIAMGERAVCRDA